jgi:hypothetical protein
VYNTSRGDWDFTGIQVISHLGESRSVWVKNSNNNNKNSLVYHTLNHLSQDPHKHRRHLIRNQWGAVDFKI